jgi:hypothetical protein
MSLRRFASLSSGLAVAIVATTGIVSFVSAHHGWALEVHTIVGFAFVALVSLHIAHNARPFAAAAIDRTRRLPRAVFIVASGVVVGVGALAYADARPARALMRWGKDQREQGQPPKTTYTMVDLGTDGAGPLLSIDLKAGPWFRFLDQEDGFELTPQIAIWVADDEGRYLDTLYVTQSEAKSEYSPTQEGQIVRRPEALPVWGHARGVKAADGIFSPTRDAPLPDVVTTASPLESAYFLTRARTSLRRFQLLVEVSNAYDFNDYYNVRAFPDDPVYMGDGKPAQPSAVYRGVLDLDARDSQYVVLRLAGHGHVTGKDGAIDPDVSHMTTGLQIVDRVLVEVDPPRGPLGSIPVATSPAGDSGVPR